MIEKHKKSNISQRILKIIGRNNAERKPEVSGKRPKIFQIVQRSGFDGKPEMGVAFLYFPGQLRSFYIFSPFLKDQYLLILRGRKIILQVRHHHFLLSKV